MQSFILAFTLIGKIFAGIFATTVGTIERVSVTPFFISCQHETDVHVLISSWRQGGKAAFAEAAVYMSQPDPGRFIPDCTAEPRLTYLEAAPMEIIPDLPDNNELPIFISEITTPLGDRAFVISNVPLRW